MTISLGQGAAGPRILRQISLVAPGLALALLVAAAASHLATIMSISAVLLTLLGGLMLAGAGTNACLGPGTQAGVRGVLRFGVALLGLQIALGEFAAMGWPVVLIVLGSLGAAMVGGTLLARRLGLSLSFAVVSASAVAICGASAALAVASTFSRAKRVEVEAAMTVAAITLLGTAAMVVYPIIATLAGLDARHSGIFLGATLHEVVHAVSAGFLVSENAGEAATVVKLLRVACLGPIMFALSSWARRRAVAGEARTPLLPPFLAMFLLLAVLTELGVVPAAVASVATELSRWCLLVAIASLGMRLSIREMISAGYRPIAAIALNTALLMVLVLSLLVLGAPTVAQG